jgi:hypothetical protein
LYPNISQRERERMSKEVEVGSASELTPGTVKGAGQFAVGNADDELFAVKYDTRTGRMTRGPQGIFAKIPGLGMAVKALTLVLPLGRGRVVERDGTLYVE